MLTADSMPESLSIFFLFSVHSSRSDTVYERWGEIEIREPNRRTQSIEELGVEEEDDERNALNSVNWEEELYEIDVPLKFTASMRARIHELACWLGVLFNGRSRRFRSKDGC
ncbi:uncharacterized protein LOC130771346 [Actinidia eriantha]|uniref:uncharacterized protein LOC130771346 n=1 Tax=Actinidia eriantha TaxID=165200 RepID=UPI002586C0B8|nr:uncharacterized protein LOC130771346 [Actinidia eriantha]